MFAFSMSRTTKRQWPALVLLSLAFKVKDSSRRNYRVSTLFHLRGRASVQISVQTVYRKMVLPCSHQWSNSRAQTNKVHRCSSSLLTSLTKLSKWHRVSARFRTRSRMKECPSLRLRRSRHLRAILRSLYRRWTLIPTLMPLQRRLPSQLSISPSQAHSESLTKSKPSSTYRRSMATHHRLLETFLQSRGSPSERSA